MKIKFKWIKWINMFVVQVDDMPDIDEEKKKALETLIKADIEAVGK